MIDSPHKPSTAMRLRAELEKRGQLRYIINTEPHGDHWTGNAFFDVPVIAHEGVRTRILNTDMTDHTARVGTFGPEEPALLEGYRANPPVITFQDSMTLHVGDHTFEMVHIPGHTLYQASVSIKEEGVVFTSGNIFHKVQTWLHEANPDLWLAALESLRKLDEEIFVPGHGAVCGKNYLDEQGAFILEWKEYVRGRGGPGHVQGRSGCQPDQDDRQVPDGGGAGRPRADGHAHQRRQPVRLPDRGLASPIHGHSRDSPAGRQVEAA